MKRPRPPPPYGYDKIIYLKWNPSVRYFKKFNYIYLFTFVLFILQISRVESHRPWCFAGIYYYNEYIVGIWAVGYNFVLKIYAYIMIYTFFSPFGNAIFLETSSTASTMVARDEGNISRVVHETLNYIWYH